MDVLVLRVLSIEGAAGVLAGAASATLMKLLAGPSPITLTAAILNPYTVPVWKPESDARVLSRTWERLVPV